MRCFLALTMGLLLVGAAPAADDGDKKAIVAVLEAQVTAWNKGDLEGFLAGYWKSEDLTFSAGGVETKGWEATLARYKQKYGTKPDEMGKLAFGDLRVQPLADGLALVRGRWQLERGKETAKGLFTLIVRKMPDGWKIIHDHTSS